MRRTLLIAEDDKHTREGLAEVLAEHYDVFQAADADEAIALMDQEYFDVVLTDLKMSGKSGLRVVDKAVNLPHKPVCVMMTAYGNVEVAVEAMKRGATDFLTKPIHIERLELILQRALEAKNLAVQNGALQVKLEKLEKFEIDGAIVGRSRVFIEALEQARQVAHSRATVLLYGETGTGKELFAQTVHAHSSRSAKAFVPVHCAAISANLLESELFGHEKGAFTGATERRIGRFETADGGTLFLDEIGEIDLQTQVKLLRFLETRTFERVGSSKSIKVDVRLICATNKDLEACVRAGTFREDLLYRLNVITLKLPPLRQRSDDIVPLLEHYLKKFAAENDTPMLRLSADVEALLTAYYWPGNVRELRNFCEKMVVIKRFGVIEKNDLDAKYWSDSPVSSARTDDLSVDAHEKVLLKKALAEARGNKTKAAQLLGISRRTLHRKLAE